jgi:CRISPR-associated protein Csx14
MAQARIPVDIFNPGQVFACMGFLEAAHTLLGYAEGGFDWTSESGVHFVFCAGGMENPVKAALEFLVKAELRQLAPRGYVNPNSEQSQKQNKGKKDKTNGIGVADAAANPPVLVETFPAPHGDRLALPIRFERNGCALDVTHWCDASSRNPFKLYAGQQRGVAIAQQMVTAIRQLLEQSREQCIDDPFGAVASLGGSSFKFDARKAWTAIDAGYSPDEQSQTVEASPVVEMLAAIGLEHARPDEFETRQVRYGIWKGLLPLALARPAFGGARLGVPLRVFRFMLDLAGKNKIVTFAHEEFHS